MAGEYTVAQITTYIKHIFEQDFALNRVSVKGEVSNCKYHTSGHLYFTLKDSLSSIACVMFAGARKKSDPVLCDGMQAVAKGNVRVFERDGRYQLYVTDIRTEGTGELYRMFEERKRRLEEMGMFAEEYKKPIPRYARTVGIVTAKTGAAIQDIQNIAARRNPYVQLILCPAQVQGAGAAQSIVRAIETLDLLGLDCMIVGRGGGSIEDLWAFNEECVARAIFQCDTPVISAVGHEIDYTIADFAADLRAPTPSAAAELAVYDYRQLAGELEEAKRRLTQAALRRTQEKAACVEQKLLQLRLLHPGAKLARNKEKLEDMMSRLCSCMEQEQRRAQYRVELAAQRLDAASPLKRLSGGYALVTDEADAPVAGISKLPADGRLRIHMKDGIVSAAVTGTVGRRIGGEHDD